MVRYFMFIHTPILVNSDHLSVLCTYCNHNLQKTSVAYLFEIDVYVNIVGEKERESVLALQRKECFEVEKLCWKLNPIHRCRLNVSRTTSIFVLNTQKKKNSLAFSIYVNILARWFRVIRYFMYDVYCLQTGNVPIIL